jgi:hypothetical protein
MHTIIIDNPHVVPPLGGPDDARYTRLTWPLAVAAACWTARLIPFLPSLAFTASHLSHLARLSHVSTSQNPNKTNACLTFLTFL